MPQHQWQPGEKLAIGTRDLVGGGRDHRKVHGWAYRPAQDQSHFRLCDGLQTVPYGIYTSVATFDEFFALRRRANRPEREDVCEVCIRVANKRSTTEGASD